MTLFRTSCILSFMICLLAGCSSKVEDPKIVAQRSKFMLNEEPSGAIAVAEAREVVKVDEKEIVLVGRVGAGQHTPWDDGKAAFYIRDAAAVIEDHGHEEGHDHENCPFCKKALIDSMAVVKFLDPEGEVIAIDARSLFGIEKDQLVVVRGQGEVDALGNLVVSANGIYIRQ